MKTGKRDVLNKSCQFYYLNQHASIKKIVTFHDFPSKFS